MSVTSTPVFYLVFSCAYKLSRAHRWGSKCVAIVDAITITMNVRISGRTHQRMLILHQHLQELPGSAKVIDAEESQSVSLSNSPQVPSQVGQTIQCKISFVRACIPLCIPPETKYCNTKIKWPLNIFIRKEWVVLLPSPRSWMLSNLGRRSPCQRNTVLCVKLTRPTSHEDALGVAKCLLG